MFCSKVWSTPEQITFQGHLSGMRSSILLIKSLSGRESFARHSVGKRRPAITPTIMLPSKIATSNNIFFTTSPSPSF